MKKGFASLVVFGVAAVAGLYASLSGKTEFIASTNLHSTEAAFNNYLARYGKSYATREEYEFRKNIYDQQMDEVITFNSQNGNSWFMALNLFSDMTPEEIKSYLGGGIAGEELPEVPVVEEPVLQQTNGPLDWRSKMNPIKNQGRCGSCWAFATIGTLEGRYAIKHGKKVTLSEQQLVDCNTACHGCNGGWASRSFTYLQSKGSQSSDSYTYTARDGACKYNSKSVVAKVTGVSGVANAKNALAGGPVAIYLQAGTNGFKSYGGGIFNGACGQSDHAVTLVGWGSQNGVEYWIIRNSWGSGWGEQGHIRIKINGNCKITFDSYPIVA